VVEHADEGELHAGKAVVEPRAHPAAGAEREVLVVAAGEVQGAVLEPLRFELLGGVPVLGVPPERQTWMFNIYEIVNTSLKEFTIMFNELTVTRFDLS
jgi:hypothetical protein